MFAFVPVSLFKIKFHVGSGRPYSEFERLILEAIGSGITEVNSLVSTFQVHRRMIIEAIVTLMGAGWLNIDAGSGEFGLSVSGKTALTKKILPEGTLLVERTLYVLMEQVAGQLCPLTDVTFQDKRKLQPIWQKGVAIPKSDIPNIVTTGMVLPFLRWDKEAWIKSIGPITIRRHNTDFIVVNVNPEDRQLSGLPKAWEPLLADILIGAVEKKQSDMPLSSEAIDEKLLQELFFQTATRSDIQWWRVRPTDIEMLPETKSTLETIVKMLDGAESHIVVSAATLDISSLHIILEAVKNALARGVAVDLCWGELHTKTAAEESEIQELMARFSLETAQNEGLKLKYNAQPHGYRFNMVFSTGPTTSVAFLGFGGLYGTISSRSNWLRITHPGLLSELAHYLADAAMLDVDLRSSNMPIRLRNEAGDLARRYAVKQLDYSEGESEARFIFDDQHIAATVQMLAQAQESAIVVSDELRASSSRGIFPSLIRQLEQKAVTLNLYYQRLHEQNDEETIQNFRKLGGDVNALTSQPPNFLITDHKIAILSAYSFLSEAMTSNPHRLKRIGISVRSQVFTDQLLGFLYESQEDK